MTLDDDFRREKLERYRAEARERLGDGASEEEVEEAAWSRWRAMLSRFGSAAFVKRQIAADEEFRKREGGRGG